MNQKPELEIRTRNALCTECEKNNWLCDCDRCKKELWILMDSLKPEHESIACDIENLWRHNNRSAGDFYQVSKRQIEAIRTRLLGLLEQKEPLKEVET